jgi:hypothetical protein
MSTRGALSISEERSEPFALAELDENLRGGRLCKRVRIQCSLDLKDKDSYVFFFIVRRQQHKIITLSSVSEVLFLLSVIVYLNV